MSLLANAKTDASIQEDIDTVGSSGPLESGLYSLKIAMAYLIVAGSGAIGLVLHLANGSREFKDTLWVQSGNAKGNRNTYDDKQTGAKKYLLGFSLANNLALLTVGKELSDIAEEEKVVSIYSYAEQKEIPTKVQMLTELLGQEILGGVFRQIENKQIKNDNGAYVDSPDGATRTKNVVDRFFRVKDRCTVAEVKAEVKVGAFIDEWTAKWQGNDRDRSNSAPGAKSGAVSGGFAAATAAKPTESLFATAAA